MTPENHLVAATLGHLENHPRREPGGDEVVRHIEHFLREPTLATPSTTATNRPLRQKG